MPQHPFFMLVYIVSGGNCITWGSLSPFQCCVASISQIVLVAGMWQNSQPAISHSAKLPYAVILPNKQTPLYVVFFLMRLCVGKLQSIKNWYQAFLVALVLYIYIDDLVNMPLHFII